MNAMKFNYYTAVTFSIFVAACNSPNELQNAEPASPSAPTVPSTKPLVAGYSHDLLRSSFDLGSNRRRNQVGFLLREEGEFGVFALNQANGAAFASTSTNSPLAHIKYHGDAKSHNETARQYFLKAGIPADQIEGIQANALMSGHGDSGGLDHGTVETEGYISSLIRSIEGVRVVDSVAWVRLSDTGQASAETVFWPAVPRDAIDVALRLKKSVSEDIRNKSEFIKRMEGEDGDIVIRHSSHTVTEAPTFFVSFDVVSHRGNTTVTRHFAPDGKEFLLRQEQIANQQLGPNKK
jgi:hypothetical protein